MKYGSTSAGFVSKCMHLLVATGKFGMKTDVTLNLVSLTKKNVRTDLIQVAIMHLLLL